MFFQPHGTVSIFIYRATLVMPLCAVLLYADSSYSQQPAATSSISGFQCNTFTFDATNSILPENREVSYQWNFGDGTTSQEPIITHTYEQSGDYMVNLTIIDADGFECSQAAASQQVRAIVPPQVSLISNIEACVNDAQTFTAVTKQGNAPDPLHYTWNFGDGTTAEGKHQVVKSFRKGGEYKVSLTADNRSANACGIKTVEKNIHINEPPVADAGAEEIARCMTGPEDLAIQFDASASYDVNNDPLSYQWDFGDGLKATGQAVLHRYIDAGHYDVKLIVTDNTDMRCGTSVDFVTVRLNQAPIAEAGENVTACPGEEIHFDGSRSFIRKPGTAFAHWTFGDGTSHEGFIAQHHYARPGIYEAVLAVENKLNSSCPIAYDTRVITVNARPSTSIKGNDSACTGEEIFFDATSAADPDGDVLDYFWSFGDGSTSRAGAKTSHRYLHGGDYRVTVVVDDKKGTSCSTAIAKTDVRINTPPIANAGPNMDCCTGSVAEFSASASSDPDGNQLLFTWDLGDGTAITGESVNHTYTRPGSYTIQLTVDDQSGTACSLSTDQFTAQVKEASKPVITIR